MREASATATAPPTLGERTQHGEFVCSTSTDGTRRFSVATYATLADLDADAEAFRSTLVDAKLVLFFVAPWVDESAALGLLAVPDHVTSIGCTAAGLVTPSGQLDAALQVVVMGGDGFAAAGAAAEYVDHGWRGAGAHVGRSVLAPASQAHRALLLLADGLTGDTAEMLRGVYRSTGAGIPIVGGCAADDLALAATRQFFGSEAIGEGVVGAGLFSSGAVGIGVSHGWQPIGEPMLVTRSSGTTVLGLDDRPALDAYLDTVSRGGERPTFNDGAEFARFALTRPLGIRDGDSGEVRFVTAGNLDRRTLDFLVHLPEGQLVWVMAGDDRTVLDATSEAVNQALAGLDGRPPIGILAFDCVARRSVVGDDRVGEESRILADALPPGLPFAGFYTYGEIARVSGSLGLHHQTLVVLALG